LEQILEDEQFLYFIHSNHKDLINFIDEQKMLQLMGYLVQEPPKDASHDRCFKYAILRDLKQG
jgi:hypothetical protein